MEKLWTAPPKGAKNKKILKKFSRMAYGLSVFAVKYPDAARQLERIGDTLSLFAATASRKANVQVIANSIFDDFIFLRDSIVEKSSVTAVDTALSELNTDIAAMLKFLEEDITSSPLNEIRDRRVSKFIVKKEKVKSVCRTAEKSLSSAMRKMDKLPSDAGGTVTSSSKTMRLTVLNGMISTQKDAVSVLSSIVDKLEFLTEYAKASPALAKTINRKIRLKPLCDIFYQPVKSKAERDKLNTELFYIIKNIQTSLDQEETWNVTLYEKLDSQTEIVPEVKTEGKKGKIQKPEMPSAQEAKIIQ